MTSPEILHYTVTPLPVTPPTVWTPHYPFKSTSNNPLRPATIADILTPVDSFLLTTERSTTTRRTTTTTRRTTTTATTASTTTEKQVVNDTEEISLLTENQDLSLTDQRTDQSFSSDLWVDVPVSGDLPQPDITGVSNVIERQIQNMRNRYVSMGVPRRYLTKNMIWKLIRGGHQPGFSFNSNIFLLILTLLLTFKRTFLGKSSS